MEKRGEGGSQNMVYFDIKGKWTLEVGAFTVNISHWESEEAVVMFFFRYSGDY